MKSDSFFVYYYVQDLNTTHIWSSCNMVNMNRFSQSTFIKVMSLFKVAFTPTVFTVVCSNQTQICLPRKFTSFVEVFKDLGFGSVEMNSAAVGLHILIPSRQEQKTVSSAEHCG